jgi:SnoaL-like domain
MRIAMLKSSFPLYVLLYSVILSGCSSSETREESSQAQFEQRSDEFGVGLVLDQWHFAASQGLFDLYFELMTPDAIFLGTDETERWDVEQFKGYAREPFSDGEGWTYTPREGGRFVMVSDDGKTAWVDETLEHERYGTLRGTAVLSKRGDVWKIAHYSLTFLIPNDKAKEVVDVVGR